MEKKGFEKVCVFGADGRTGIEVARYAKEKGYIVVPFSYTEGQDVLNRESVDKCVSQCDAVISTLGHIKGSDELMQTKGINNIVKAMEENGVDRILSLTGTGVRVDGDMPSCIDRFLNVAVGIVDPNRMRDGIEHFKVLKNSGLNWTVVRVLKLTKNNSDVRSYTLSENGPAELMTSRKKVAQVLVDLLAEEETYGKLPVVSG